MATSDQLIPILPGNAKLNTKGTNIISDCPFCGKTGHFAVGLYKKVHGKDNPWRCLKCGERGTIFKLLQKLNRLDLLGGYEVKSVDYVKLEKKINQTGPGIDLTLPKAELPFGFRRTYQNTYLESRGFTEEDYERYPVGATKFDNALNNYLIFPQYENNICIGWLARHSWEKEKFNEYNAKAKAEGRRKLLRWQNSQGTDFAKMLGGFNELTPETKTVLLVEGLFGKYNVDRILNLHADKEVKCLCTYGKSISTEQIIKLKNAGIKNIIILHDNDATNDTKKTAFLLDQDFDTWVGFFKDEKDSGDISEKELEYILENLEKPLNFKVNKLLVKKLN